MPSTTGLIVLFFAATWAGAQNALAGGGSFITLPSLMFTGMDARAANITSTIALFPGQIATGWTGRDNVTGAAGLSFVMLLGISLVGGALGAMLLLLTPSESFARLVPWLVLFATAVFAWGTFGPRRRSARPTNRWLTLSVQFLISIYGGYFGGGIGFLMLAALTAAGLAIRNAGASKNVLAAAMNASAVAILAFSPEVHWLQAGIACVGAVIGGVAGGKLLNRIDERILRGVVIVIGVVLTVGLFIRAP
jgi:hypothetical protein